MDRYVNEIVLAILGVIFIISGLIWPSVFVRTLGYICFAALISMFIGRLIVMKFTKEDPENGAAIGCMPWMIIIGLITILFFCKKDFTYVSSSKDGQHIYEDCQTIKGYDVQRVREVDAFLLGKRKACTICIARKKQIQKEQYERRQREERERMIDALYESIKDVQEGDSPEDIIEQLIEDFGFDVVSYCKDCGYEIYE